jgi:hypothetical protein
MTGLRRGQLTELAARAAAAIGDVAKPGRQPRGDRAQVGGRGGDLDAHEHHPGDCRGISGCPQATVSWRGPAAPRHRRGPGGLHPGPAPDPRRRYRPAGRTIAPTWDWAAIPDLFPGKAGYPGTNLQIAAALGGRVAATGPDPVHGTHAFESSGLKALLAGLSAAASWVTLAWRASPSCRTALRPAATYMRIRPISTRRSGIRTAAERGLASVKTWRMLSDEDGRYRAPISKYGEMLAAVTGLFFFRNQVLDGSLARNRALVSAGRPFL